MTPLIDVMLVLLVMFMLAAPVLVSAIRVELPQGQGGRALQPPAHVAITLDGAGRVQVDGVAVDDVALARILARAAASDARTELQLSADVHVPYGRVVEIMALAHRHGLTRMGFITQPRP